MSEQTNKVIEKFRKKFQRNLWKEIVEGYATCDTEVESFLTQELESLEEKVKEEYSDELKKILEGKKISWIKGVKLPTEERWKHILNAQIDDIISLLSSHPLQDKEDDLPNIHPNACECRICYKDKQTARKYVKKNFGDVIKKLSER